ncbi:putative reverse transcriptase domain-containing protein [Tanacetum coccineum]
MGEHLTSQRSLPNNCRSVSLALPAMLAQVSNQGNVGNQSGNVVNENVQENVGNVIIRSMSRQQRIPNDHNTEVVHISSAQPNEETSKDKMGRDDNKRTRTGNAFGTNINPIGRREYGYYGPSVNSGGVVIVNDCRGVPRNMNPVNAINPTVKACYKCGSTDHVSFVSTTFIPMLGLEHSDLGFKYEIKIASGQLVEIDKIEFEPPGADASRKVSLVGFGTLHNCSELSDNFKELPRRKASFDQAHHRLGDHPPYLEMCDSVYRMISSSTLRLERIMIHVDPSKIEAVFDWGKEQELTFQTLKDKLCNAPILALPDRLEDFVVYCDVSGIGLAVEFNARGKDDGKPMRLGLQKGLDEMIEQRSDETLYYLDQIWVPLKGEVLCGTCMYCVWHARFCVVRPNIVLQLVGPLGVSNQRRCLILVSTHSFLLARIDMVVSGEVQRGVDVSIYYPMVPSGYCTFVKRGGNAVAHSIASSALGNIVSRVVDDLVLLEMKLQCMPKWPPSCKKCSPRAERRRKRKRREQREGDREGGEGKERIVILEIGEGRMSGGRRGRGREGREKRGIVVCVLREKKSLIFNTSFLGEYGCSSLALDRRRKNVDEIGSLETRLDNEIPTSPGGFDSNEEEVVPKVDDVSLVDGVFDGAFGGDGEEDFVMGEGVVVSSSSLVRSTKSCLGGIMVSLIFLEGLEEEACVDAMEVEEKWSREKHIELVNIIGEPLAGITTRSRVRDLEAASAHECLYVNFLSEMKPKKIIEALEE